MFDLFLFASERSNYYFSALRTVFIASWFRLIKYWNEYRHLFASYLDKQKFLLTQTFLTDIYCFLYFIFSYTRFRQRDVVFYDVPPANPIIVTVFIEHRQLFTHGVNVLKYFAKSPSESHSNYSFLSLRFTKSICKWNYSVFVAPVNWGVFASSRLPRGSSVLTEHTWYWGEFDFALFTKKLDVSLALNVITNSVSMDYCFSIALIFSRSTNNIFLYPLFRLLRGCFWSFVTSMINFYNYCLCLVAGLLGMISRFACMMTAMYIFFVRFSGHSNVIFFLFVSFLLLLCLLFFLFSVSEKCYFRTLFCDIDVVWLECVMTDGYSLYIQRALEC